MASEKETKRTAKGFAEDSQIEELKRRFRANPFVFIGTIIVLVIVIIAFVLVPAIVPSAGGLDSGKLTFGYYNGTPVTYTGNNYFAQLRQQYAQYAQYYGFDEYTVWERAYHGFVTRTAILDIMKEAGYEPPAEVVNKKTAQLPQFLDENGKFSRSLYNRLDAATRLSLLVEVKNDILLERYRNDLSNARVSTAEKAFIGEMAKVQRAFKVASIAYSFYPDDELAAFAEKNPDLFMSLRLSQITIPKESDAKKALKAIQDGTSTFEDTARNQSKDEFAGRGGDTGTRLAHELKDFISTPEDFTALRSLAKGTVSEIIQTTDGWSIFRAEEDAKPVDTGDSSSISKIRTYVTANEKGMIEDYLLAKADQLAADVKAKGSADGFEQAAKDAGFTTADFGPLPVNYGDCTLFSTLGSFSGIEAFQGAPNTPKTGAAFDNNFWQTAYGTVLNETSKPIVLTGRQSYIALIYPKEETTDTGAQDNSESMFTSTWVENTVSQNVEDTVLASKKFEDDFDVTFQSLFPDQYYQHSFSGISF